MARHQRSISGASPTWRRLLQLAALAIATAIVSLPSSFPASAEAAESPREGRPPETLTFSIPAGGAGAKQAPLIECVVSRGPAATVSALAFGPGGRLLAAGGYKEVVLWDLEDAKLSRRIGAGDLPGSVNALSFIEEGRSLAVGGGVPGRPSAVKVFAVESGQVVAAFDGPGEVVYCLAASPDGKLLAAGGADGKVRVWDLAAKKLSRTIEDHSDWVLGAAFSPDGKTLATAGADKTLLLWDTETWERAASYRYAEALHCVAFHPKGLLVAVGVGGPTERAVRARSKEDVKSARALYNGQGLPLGLAWDPTGTRIFAALSDKTVKSIASPGGGVAAVLGGHDDWVHAVALSPDGSLLASGSADGTVKLWRPPEGRPKAPPTVRPRATLAQLGQGTDRWIIFTAPGYLATSSPEAIQWKTKGAAAAPEVLARRLLNPGAVRDLLAGKEVAAPPLRRGGRP